MTLSLEMHCGLKQQDKIASYLIDILGEENIYILPPGIADIDDPTKIPKFPSPNELMKKYIIKAKASRIVPISSPLINKKTGLNI